MASDASEISPCTGQVTDLLALLKHLNAQNTTLSSPQSNSSTIGVSFVIVIVVSSVVVIVNLATLLAIGQVRRISAYLRLVISLSIADILIGIRMLVQTMDVQQFLGSDLDMCLSIHLRGIKMTSHLISLFNLLGLGLDHYCAIVRPLNHRFKMSVSRTNALILLFWIVSALCGFSDFFIPAPSYDYCSEHSLSAMVNSTACDADNIRDLLKLSKTNMTPDLGLSTFWNLSYDHSQYNPGEQPQQETSPGIDNTTNSSAVSSREQVTLADVYTWQSESINYTEEGFCYSVMCSRYDTEYLIFTVAALLLIAMSFIYIRVCVKIYSMRLMLTGRYKRTFHQNKKGLITTMCIVGIFMICWLPFCIFTTMTLINMSIYPHLAEEYYSISVKLNDYLYALLLLNCLCDPVIYALRMREVKLGYRRLLGRCFKKYKHSYHLSTTLSSSRYSTRNSVMGSNKWRPRQQYNNNKFSLGFNGI